MRKIKKLIIHCSDSSFGDAALVRRWHIQPKMPDEIAEKIRNKELWKKAFQKWLSQYEYYDIDMVTLHTDVIGNVGIASGNFNIKRKHKENPEFSVNKRWSSTWLKTNGQWKLIFYHREFIDELY